MPASPANEPQLRKTLSRPLRLTWAGMLAERVTRAFWPAWTVLLAGLAPLGFGLHDHLSRGALIAALGLAGLALLVALGFGLRRFRWPSRDEALARLDRTMPGRPISALADAQAIGATDAGSAAVWRVHLARMAARLKGARPVAPDLRVSSADPLGLRYIALTGFAAALIFGSLLRVASVADVALGPQAALAGGPAWEGWAEPPAYTDKPALYLNDILAGDLSLPKGTRVTLRLYGEVGALETRETVSGRPVDSEAAREEMVQSFEVAQPGAIAVEGPGGRAWQVALTPDMAPSVAFTGVLSRKADGQMEQPFRASDDYGVVAGQAVIALDLASIDRRYGLVPAPEPREALVLDLPMTITGDRVDFTETIVENLSEHPWAGLPVTVTLQVQDARGQEGLSEPRAMALPGRRFFDPLAKAIIEQRRDLLWTRENASRVSQVLRAVSYLPDDLFRDSSSYLRLRAALRQLEAGLDSGLSVETRDEVAQALWELALEIELGDLDNALERLQRAQDRLSEAMKNGARDEEIAELMQELREAMQDYMRQLAQQQQQDGNQQAQNNEDMQTITGDQLEEMLNRLQQLMEEGRMAEAQQLMEMLNQMMQNMQVTQGPGGQQSPGEQAMEGLAETLRDQQGLSDEAFNDLNQQFNQPGQQGQQQGQQGQQQGQQGQQQGEGQGQGQDGDQQGEGQMGQNQGEGVDPGMGLADRQRALREELRRQQEGLPGLGGEEGRATQEALDRAGRAMDDAERQLREDDLAGALDSQAEAMDALRDGMRNLGEALAQQQQNQQGQQGQAMGSADPNAQRDPLGRERGQQGRVGTDESMLQEGDIQDRARELVDEIRRRSADQERPEEELDYLKRLLDRF